jgi:hypothetical protein
VQAYKSKSVKITEIAKDPNQPRPFEKNKNMSSARFGDIVGMNLPTAVNSGV